MKTPWQYAETGNEFSHQVALFQWCAVAARHGANVANDPRFYSGKNELLPVDSVGIPELQWLHAIKNQGHGDAIRGARSAMEGVKAGVPDIFLPVPRPTILKCGAYYCGLYIEIKRPGADRKAKGFASAEQLKWREHLLSVGYAWELCFGWESARDAILQYLGR